jgi:cell division protein ZapE
MAARAQPGPDGGPETYSVHARRDAKARGLTLDEAQLEALAAFDRLAADLARTEQSGLSLFRMFQRQQPVRGLYLWGAVGRGKSFLMDGFFDWVPIKRKQRIHFHRFMQDVHRDLKQVQGAENPLLQIARERSRDLRLLCLDEFHVTDIGDAMLMRNLLEGLFDHGIVLVTTSNQHPDGLYRDGLQRAQFVPAIELIKARLDVVEVDGRVDYRLRALEKGGVYHAVINEASEKALEATFEAIAGSPGDRSASLEIEGRSLPARRVGPGVAWFDFPALCDGPRGQADYIELARRFHTVLVSGLPRFGASNRDIRRRFTWLVDEFYDRRVKLIISGRGELSEIFAALPQDAETERTLSRLIEMQTHQYLGEPHLA